MNSIWDTLPQPFFVLAPMEDVTDTVFRRIVASIGRPDLFFTEFTNVDGILSVASDIVSQRLQFLPEEHPIIAQVWGNNPEKFYQVAQRLVTMGFDGIDINMGCPEKNVVKKEAGGGCIKNPTLAKEIVAATKEGAGKVPVSVKTRIGFNKIITEEWCGMLLEQQLAALTIHGRTVAEESKVPAHWDEIGKVVQMRDTLKLNTKIVGNGDVMSKEQGIQLAKEFGVDGIMVGRGIFHNPWLFSGDDITTKTIDDRLRLLEYHMDLFSTTWGAKKHFDILKKFFKAYLRDFDGAGELRAELMLCKNPEEVKEKIQALQLH